MWSDEQTRENLMTESTEATASVVETIATEPSTDIESARDAEAAVSADAPHETPDPSRQRTRAHHRCACISDSPRA
jgi:hypothetical protein